MKDENEKADNLHTGLKRREFMAVLAGCTAGLMVPSLIHGDGSNMDIQNRACHSRF